MEICTTFRLQNNIFRSDSIKKKSSLDLKPYGGGCVLFALQHHQQQKTTESQKDSSDYRFFFHIREYID